MKNLLNSIAFLVLTLGNAHAADFYVSPTGSPTGSGSIADPWDIVTGLKDNRVATNKNFVVKPGDTVWLRGGKYNGVFVSDLNGDVAGIVLVRGYPGERVTLDNNAGNNVDGLLARGSYAWYMDFEVMSSASVPNWANNVGYTGSDLKFISLILHDAGVSGIGPTNASANVELHGCLFYYNGRGPAPNHGYGTYIQNLTPEGKKVINNIFVNNWGWYGIHAYGEGARVDNLTIEGNTLVNNSIILGGPNSAAENAILKSNFTYRDDSSNPRTIVSIGYAYFGAGTKNASVTDNYFAGGLTAIRQPYTRLALTGNTFYGEVLDSFGSSSSPWSTTAWPNNTYHLFRAGAIPPKPADRVFIRQNTYDLNRANITIYNWSMNGSVQVDLSGVLRTGDEYRIQDAQNYWGSPVVAGTYSGGAVPIPMTSTEIVKPVSYVSVNIPTTHTSAEFGAFILIKGGATVPPPPPPVDPPPPPPPVNAVQIYLEAETGTLVAPMAVSAHALASGGQYVASPMGDTGSAQFAVNVTVPGTYVIWCRVLSPVPAGDSFFVSVDGGAEDVYDNAEGSWSPNWQWTKVNGRQGGVPLTLNPRTFSLSAGSHTIKFRTREANSTLDRLLLTNDLAFVPADSVPPPVGPIQAPKNVKVN